MRIVFMGTPGFAVPSLKAIHESHHEVVGVITAPDRPAGRGKKLRKSDVKVYAEDASLKILQPTRLKDPNFIEELRLLKADLFVVVAFRMLPEVVWTMPEKGTINLHASLLPNYRGAAPINHAVINGETESGVSTFFIEKEIDTGKIIDQVKVGISDGMTAGELHDSLMKVGSELLLNTINRIEKGDIQPIDQSELIREQDIKPAPKLNREFCRIAFDKPAEEVRNKILGLAPYPGAWTLLVRGDEKIQFKIINADLYRGNSIAGTIETNNKDRLVIHCLTGAIDIKDLQMQGKRKMPIEEFLRGFSFEEDDLFE